MSNRNIAERSASPLWLWPALAATIGLIAAVLLLRVRPDDGGALTWLWYGDPDSARSVLQVMATSVMTATTLTFSLTVVALQLASQQFSPRLLREFGRDPVTKRVLSVLATTFVFTSTALYGIRSDEAVPDIAVLAGFLLGVASLGAILAFITHIVKVVRVDTMMLMVHDETDAAIRAYYPPYDDDRGAVRRGLLPEHEGTVVLATRSGFLRMTDVDGLVELAQDHDVFIRIDVRAGDHVVAGSPVATAWAAGGAPLAEADEALVDGTRRNLTLGYERTMHQDAGFGFRQLEDIAVKAMSPGINDPVTAAHAVGHMADLLVRLTSRRLGPTLHADGAGVGRVIVPDRDLRYYLDLACGQLRRFASGEPSVLVALLRMLRDVAASCRDDDQRAEVRRAAALVRGELAEAVGASDAAFVREVHERVELALAGDRAGAYADRAGETRSI